ncbi:hypothetical protein NDA01_31195 [Trichocoleus desertorum AS-A10]|uniref:hypothetical protein n=1 Tax=Trichocoleus desertorum TaxID=1481672 RepID=UPI00329A2E48
MSEFWTTGAMSSSSLTWLRSPIGEKLEGRSPLCLAGSIERFVVTPFYEDIA